MRRKWVFVCILLAAVIFAVSCTKQQVNFGKGITLVSATKIKDILSNLKKYNNQLVRVEGKIINECPAGHWFDLADDTGQIHISLVPEGSTIPPKVGAKAIVEGRVSDQGYIVEIAGEAAEIK